MTVGAWKARWSVDLEESWSARHRMSGGHGPRESIRPDRTLRASRDRDTRPLDAQERGAMQAVVPDPWSHRKIVTFDPAEPTPTAGRLHQEIEIQGLIARGGMGAVYRARQVSLDREVAVKRLRPNLEIPDGEAQFESEACITAVLDHPNIVPVHDLGVDQHDRLFYTMKHIRGTPWDELLARRPAGSVAAASGDDLDLRGHLDVLVEVANAVAFAHSKGILHRDIKPQNVVVGAFGEVLLVDWGLGVALRPLDQGGRIQDLQQVMITCGTPAYMPPEIALGLRDHVGTWTDVYMLGAVLYELLYETVPHDESTALDTVKVASANIWAFPEVIAPALRPYHEVFRDVIARSLATPPAERFVDGAQFAVAVRRALRHLDSAALASDAIELFAGAEREESAAQQQRAVGRDAGAFGSVENRYRALARAIAGLEHALSSWSDNAEARHYLVEAHLLYGHIAIVSGDLTQAESHLQSLGSLPHEIAPDPTQHDKLASLRRRLREKIEANHVRRRRGRAWTAAAAVLAVAVVVGTLLAALLIGRARDRVITERNHLASLLIASAADGVGAELQRLFEPVRGALRGSADWVEAGRLDSNDPQVLSSYFIPLIDGYPFIASIVLADSDGQEYLLLRDDDGWTTRTTTPGEPTRFATLSLAGEPMKQWEETVDYDSHSRPWYRGGDALRGEGKRYAIHWTEPYTFFTRQEPGITASMPLQNPNGRRFVVGVDVPLSHLSTFTMNRPDSEFGKVFILAEDDRVIALPRSPQFQSADARRQAALQPIGAIGDAVPAAAVAQWDSDGRDSGRRFRLIADGQPWWGGFRRFDLGEDRVFWIGVVLPESDFVAGDPH